MRQPIPFGKYLLLDRVSVGGMAEVFRAKTFGVEGFEKLVAIKRILPSMGEDEDFVRMFVDEAKIVGQLTHANVCQIFELGKHEATHFIAMEYIWGKDLLQVHNRLRKLGERVPVPLICYLVAKICEGLDYAHRKRDPLGAPLEIVHRDCSPQNILLSYQGEVKLIDFGIAKSASRSARTNAGVLKGKFGYMSPEQVRGLPLDRRSDIFSLGTILYETLTGSRLFLGESDFSTLEKVRNADIQPPTLQRPDLPAEVERIVLRALRRNPADRYQWASEMHDDLRSYLTKQPVPVTAKGIGELLQRLFATEHERERALLDRYRHIGPDGSFDEHRGPPPVEPPEPEVVESLAAGDFGIRPRGRPDGEFDERPTEIYGEIEEELELHEVETSPEPAPPAEVAPIPEAAPPAAPPEAASVPQPVSPRATQRVHPLPAAPWAGVVVEESSSTGRFDELPLPGRRRRRRGSLATDVAVGVGITALVLLLFVGVRWLVLGDGESAAAPAQATATLAVVVSDEDAAEVWLDGETVGAISGGAPLTLEGVTPGAHALRVVRPGVAPCERSLELVADKVEVVTCRFAEVETSAELVLAGLAPAQRVFLDGQEISREAARRPLVLESAREHRIAVREGDRVVDELAVTLAPGERRRHEIPAAPPEPEGRADAAPPRRAAEREPERPSRPPERERPPRAEPPASAEEAGADEAPTVGYFMAYTRPWARVHIDGRDTGKMTPIAPRAKIELPPGEHIVTFVVGTQRFEYPVEIRAGQTERLVRDLPVD